MMEFLMNFFAFIMCAMFVFCVIGGFYGHIKQEMYREKYDAYADRRARGKLITYKNAKGKEIEEQPP